MNASSSPNINAKRLTAAQVADHESVSRRTVLQWYHDGIVPAEYHVGKVIRFDLCKVRSALEKFRSRPPAA